MRLRRTAFAATALLLSLTTGCVSGLASTQAPSPIATTSAPGQPVGSVPPKPAIPTVLEVKHPWQPGQFQDGIQIYWHTRGDALIAQADSILDYVVKLDANSVGITFPIYTDGPAPTKVYAGPETPSMSDLTTVVLLAKARHLRVSLRPTIDEANIVSADKNGWRGSIAPINTAAWFASYQSLLASYARLAQTTGVSELIVGTELSSLQSDTSDWQQLRQHLGTLYSGLQSYSLNWDSSSTMPFSITGIDAYPQVHLGDNATVPQLASAIQSWIASKPVAIRHNLTIEEAGIPAQSGMYAHPYLWGKTNLTPNLAVQSNWFSAMCDAAHASGVNGLYFWSVDSNANVTKPNVATEPSASFIGKPAEASIKHCFAASSTP